MDNILLLNSTYEPLSLLSLRRAVKLLLKERVEPAAHESVALVGVERTLLIPAVLRLTVQVNIHWNNPPCWTRQGLMRRDRYTCAYCGKICRPHEATVDHVLPTSRGGPTCWSNTVVACYRCNQLKADRTPREAGMKLLISPRAPGFAG